MTKLDVDLGRWLFQQRPRLMDCALDDTAEAMNALAATLGCLLATIRARAGERAYTLALEAMLQKVEATAKETVRAAIVKKGSYSNARQ